MGDLSVLENEIVLPTCAQNHTSLFPSRCFSTNHLLFTTHYSTSFHLPFLLLPLLSPSAMQQLFIDSNDQWERVLWEPSPSRSPGAPSRPAANHPARALFTFPSNPGMTTGCAEATEPEHSVFWMKSHQQDGRDALGAPLQQKSISQAAEVSL